MTRAQSALTARLKPLGLYRLDGTTLVDAELAAYGAGFALVESELDELERECFIQTAQSWGLVLREQAMGLLLRPNSGPEKRRELLLYRLAVAPSDYNPKGMVNSIRAAGLNAVIVENSVTKHLRIIENGYTGSYQNIDAVEADVRRMLPAHLTADFDIGSLTWNRFDAANESFNTFDAKNIIWNQWDSDNGQLYPA